MLVTQMYGFPIINIAFLALKIRIDERFAI